MRMMRSLRFWASGNIGDSTYSHSRLLDEVDLHHGIFIAFAPERLGCCLFYRLASASDEKALIGLCRLQEARSVFDFPPYILDDMQVVYGLGDKNAKLKKRRNGKNAKLESREMAKCKVRKPRNGEMAKMQSSEAAMGAAVSSFCKEKKNPRAAQRGLGGM